ncbi:MAG: hypothetical protein IK135_02565 [Bacteroidales bacterium]|nr:hypothetical protein [Bacteroidales bacterium]
MRKIKYRAKVKLPERPIVRKYEVPEGQWVYGEPHTIDCLTPHIHTANGDVGKQPIDEETICQFTSLYDRNKKEIYEGDLLKLQDDDTGLIEVRFVRGVFAFLWQGNLDEEMPINAPTHEWATVVGNIHDNPELLKGGEE